VLRDKPDALVRLNELLVLDTLMVVRIPINTCEVEQLAAHPYAGWKVAKALMAYRAQHGPFRTVADIRGCALIDEAVFRKLAPYLRVE
jgi:DNA uptake protein ComE-like DNA-binding protein